jgi:plastocyanin
MRKLIVLVIAACALAVLAATAMAATRTVKVGDDYFVRPSGTPKITVSKGTTVRFNFSGAVNPHTVTRLRGPSFKSCSDTCRRTLKKRGTYRLYCTVHGAADQSMRIVVK